MVRRAEQLDKSRPTVDSRNNLSALATTMHELERDKATLASDPDNLKVIFKEMIQMCLWCAVYMFTTFYSSRG